MMPEIHSNLHKLSKDRKMFLCSMLIFSFTLVSASDNEQESFRCGRRGHDVCDELSSLRTEVDVNTADRRKWNRYFQFVQRFHRSWEDEVAIAVSRITERMSSSGDLKLTNALSNDNGQLRKEMVNLQTRLDAQESASLSIRAEVDKERETMKKIENELLNDNHHLRGEMEALQRKLDALESISLNTRSDLEKEREAWKKIENEVKKTLPSLLFSIPSNLTERFGEVRNGLESLNLKMESLESEASAIVDEVDKQRDSMKKLKSSISRLRWATLTAARIIRSDEPASKADEIIKELNDPLDAASGDLERDLPHFQPGNFSTENPNSKALDELNNKLDGLQSNMRILSDMIGKATSKIQILEGKYNEALRAQVLANRRRSGTNYEFVENHPKPGDRRPFDSKRDP